MKRFLALILFAGVVTKAHALRLDRQLATHCGALLLAGAHDRPSSRDEFVGGLGRYLERLDVPAADPDPKNDDVQTLALEGWDQEERRAQSARRLQTLVRDLERWPEVTSVVFATRGHAEIAGFLARLEGRVSRLDRAAYRQAARNDLKLPALTAETASAAALLLAGGLAGQAVPPSLLSAYLETAGIVSAAYLARAPARRLWDLLVPPGLLDVGRVKLDSHLRVVAQHGLSRAHIGLGTPVSVELIEELRRARASDELEPRKLARLLLGAGRAEPGGHLLVDHVTFVDDEGQPVLLSAVRVAKRNQPTRARNKDYDWTPALTPEPLPIPIPIK